MPSHLARLLVLCAAGCFATPLIASEPASLGEIVRDATTFEAATAEILENYEIPAGARPRLILLPDIGGERLGSYRALPDEAGSAG